ncbi:MAG TPA: threonylcarbamoyl-AMP synthase [Chloroflexi bacterium]|jgi:L-threonylcarbamoyladenylate synthase|nr:threonylcarbamoyl-AMP synthase [Chloroflexota bacterium]
MNEGGTPRRIATRALSADDAEALPAALRILRSGGTVVFPTDTVYGVGSDPWSPEAVARLYWVKQRPREMAIPLLVSAPHHVERVVSDLPDAFQRVAARFWPGGLTLVLPRHPAVPHIVTAGGPTIAVRMPGHPLARALIEAAGGVLAVTSANRSGNPAPVTAEAARADLDGRVDLVIDGGASPCGVASAVIDLVRTPPRQLRAGGIPFAALRVVLPDLVDASRG